MPVELTKDHLIYINIGARYWDASQDQFNSRQKKIIGGYLSQIEENVRNGYGLYLWGENNVGKSYISAVICKMVWAKYRVTSYCVTAAELKEAWINDRPAHPDSHETMAERVEEARLLVIDDLGKEHRAASGFAENKFGALLRNRSRSRKTTIITTNIHPKEFSKVYGTSTGELVKEHLYALQVKGPDMRGKIADAIVEFMRA